MVNWIPVVPQMASEAPYVGGGNSVTVCVYACTCTHVASHLNKHHEIYVFLAHISALRVLILVFPRSEILASPLDLSLSSLGLACCMCGSWACWSCQARLILVMAHPHPHVCYELCPSCWLPCAIGSPFMDFPFTEVQRSQGLPLPKSVEASKCLSVAPLLCFVCFPAASFKGSCLTAVPHPAPSSSTKA